MGSDLRKHFANLKFKIKSALKQYVLLTCKKFFTSSNSAIFHDHLPDETRKAKLLHWVQDMLPRVPIEDFTVSWQDGVALCSLLEEVCTGLCPRPDLLKPHHRVNNCRLGIKLAQKYLRLPKVRIAYRLRKYCIKNIYIYIISV